MGCLGWYTPLSFEKWYEWSSYHFSNRIKKWKFSSSIFFECLGFKFEDFEVPSPYSVTNWTPFRHPIMASRLLKVSAPLQLYTKSQAPLLQVRLHNNELELKVKNLWSSISHQGEGYRKLWIFFFQTSLQILMNYLLYLNIL